jgi:hypothetical protein
VHICIQSVVLYLAKLVMERVGRVRTHKQGNAADPYHTIKGQHS